MRIISGKYKGKKIISPEDNNIRPTSDRTRGALFNILCHGKLKDAEISTKTNFSDLSVLDAFAGTGALGLEAFSRGAEKVTFVEKSKQSLKILNSNISLFNENKKLNITNQSAISFNNKNNKFDVIFADPPYNKDLVEPFINHIIKNKMLNKKALIVIETDQKEEFSYPDEFEVLDIRKYGKAKISIFKYCEI